jgi:hypothetical protein
MYDIQNSIRISHETYCVFSSKANWLMYFKEKITIYFEINMKHTSTFCGQDAEFQYVETGSVHSNH